MSTDGRTLYASSTDDVYQWSYDPTSRSVSNQVTLVNGMSGTDHTTRTLLLSRKAPGMLTVSRGSTSNIDIESASLDSGHSQVKAFNLTARGTNPYDFTSDGIRLGWGLRNEVGVGEHPVSGGIWGVENSADQMIRYGVDIHQNNPAEELNFLGYLNGTYSANQGKNFGYPWCFTAWKPSELPMNSNISVGTQFAISPSSDSNNQNQTDAYCAAQVAPRLAFQAHMAPLDIKFNDTGRQAWVTFHGSWDRDIPVGYKLSLVNFNANGEPTDPSTSTTAATDIVSNADNTACPNNCLRPVAMAIDSRGRIFMSSDASGEIYLVTRDTTAAGASPSVSASRTASASGTSATNSGAASSTHQLSLMSVLSAWAVSLFLLS